MIDEVLEWLLPPIFGFVRRKCRLMVQTSELHLFQSFTRLLDSLLDDVREAGKPLGPKMSEDKMTNLLQCLIVFVIPWTIASTITGTSRRMFDSYYRQLLNGRFDALPRPESFKLYKSTLQPEHGLVYDFLYDKDANRWVPWYDTIDKDRHIIPADATVSKLLIPTAETARQEFFLKTCLNHDVPLLLLGPTGTGKTAITNSTMAELPQDKFVINNITFSARTTAGQAQDIIMSKVDRRRKGVYGPAMGRKYVVFVDDVNMPQKEEYGAQPPIEFLRQWLDHKHFYDKKDTSKIELVDSMFVGAMVPPGGGRQSICGRFTRHLNVVSIDAFDDATLDKIFGAIVTWHYSTAEDSAIQRLSRAIVTSTREMYKLSMSTFLPTPSKSHYVFNLRDFSRVISGILLVPITVLTSVEKLVRLWIHEVCRVFHDRLSDFQDRETFFGLVKDVSERCYHLQLKSVLIIFGDYIDPDADNKFYNEIENIDDLNDVMNSYLNEYNLISKSSMDLVMFQYMIQHVSRISRVLKQDSGHALLIGLGGSGRQSATKLAAFMSNYDLFQIEVTKTYGVNEWREDIKRVLMKAGGDGKPTVFLLTDTQIKDETFIEDVNTLLNMGDLPNLYANEEKAEILEKIQLVAKEE
ncbi:unnamed protein product, partial [Meganyctiphanes norvegica]